MHVITRSGIKEPIKFLFLSESNDNLMTTPRIHLYLKKNSSMTFFEEHFVLKGSHSEAYTGHILK